MECTVALGLSSFNTKLLHITGLYLFYEHPGAIQVDCKAQPHRNILLAAVQVGCTQIWDEF